MLFRPTRPRAARILLAASVALGVLPGVAHAQTAGQAELDPNAPMDAMPDLGVAWPDMSKPGPAAPVEPVTAVPAATSADLNTSTKAAKKAPSLKNITKSRLTRSKESRCSKAITRR